MNILILFPGISGSQKNLNENLKPRNNKIKETSKFSSSKTKDSNDKLNEENLPKQNHVSINKSSQVVEKEHLKNNLKSNEKNNSKDN